ncbi:retrovirus-related Pol polyprotein from transposon 17.6 [Nephila pilipes]|uniref:Retrovirus-related Pol polyprotein from transposon 17.6 n=1 Tax=Nephila pilipes TaxID=299642 RepID=A0A8X6M9J5_NEPPI|nr:retrovirus-related Pol polyprotein from transposon 17.6 [Nephila pilipes]
MFLLGEKLERPSLGSPGDGRETINRGIVQLLLFNFSQQMEPPFQITGAKRNDRAPILWSENSTAAFEKCKTDLVEATVLYHPAADALLNIVVDASDTAIGAALHQQGPKGWQLLAFFSKTFSPAQRHRAYYRELLAAYMAIKYLQHMVEGLNFILFTDLKPLIYAFKQKEDKCFPRLTFVLKHREAAHNSVLSGRKRPNREVSSAVERVYNGAWQCSLDHSIAHHTFEIPSTWKENLQATTVEMISGDPIRLSGEFLCPSKQIADPATFIGGLKESMQLLSPPTTH